MEPPSGSIRSETALGEFGADFHAALQRQGDRRALGDLGHALLLFVIDIANEGNVMVKPQGEMILKDGSGNVVVRRELKLDNVLAGSMVPYQFIWNGEAVPAGNRRRISSSPLSPGRHVRNGG